MTILNRFIHVERPLDDLHVVDSNGVRVCPEWSDHLPLEGREVLAQKILDAADEDHTLYYITAEENPFVCAFAAVS